MPTPAQTPSTVHQMTSDPSRSIINSGSTQPIQNIGSQEFMERKPSVPMNCGQQISASIANACAGLRPPSAQVISPQRKIMTAPASAERMRIANSESPKRISPSRACTATIGP